MDKLSDIDRRAFAANLTLSALAKKAGVSSGTMAKLGKGIAVRPRVMTKLEATLDAIEHERAIAAGILALSAGVSIER